MAEYRMATEVRAIAAELIEEHHTLLESRGPRIEYLFTRPSTPGGKEQRFKIRKVTGVNTFLATHPLPDRFGLAEQSFVVIEISQMFWKILTDEQALGLMDHLLSYLKYDHDKDAWTIEGPEFGEFPGVLERHGDWRPEDSFKKFATRVSMQPSLLLELEDDASFATDTDEDTDEGEQEVLDVSITTNGRTVHTNTETMRKLGEHIEGSGVLEGAKP